MIYGIDVSGYQPGIDFSAVPCDFVSVYVSGGTASGNAYGRDQIQGAIANGKRVMPYHFENDGTPGTPQQEAEWFLTMLEHVGPLPPNTLYALDNETGNARNVEWQRQFLDIIRAAKGPGVGMYAPFDNIMTGIYQPLRDAGYFIWESAYVLGYQKITGYTVPGGRAPIPGGDPAIWQFTSQGILPGWGGVLDLNVFLAGGPAEWDAIAGNPPIKPTQEGLLMSLTDDQQAEVLADTRELTANVEKLVNFFNAGDPTQPSDFVELRDNARKLVYGQAALAAAVKAGLTVTDAQVQALAAALGPDLIKRLATLTLTTQFGQK